MNKRLIIGLSTLLILALIVLLPMGGVFAEGQENANNLENGSDIEVVTSGEETEVESDKVDKSSEEVNPEGQTNPEENRSLTEQSEEAKVEEVSNETETDLTVTEDTLEGEQQKSEVTTPEGEKPEEISPKEESEDATPEVENPDETKPEDEENLQLSKENGIKDTKINFITGYKKDEDNKITGGDSRENEIVIPKKKSFILDTIFKIVDGFKVENGQFIELDISELSKQADIEIVPSDEAEISATIERTDKEPNTKEIKLGKASHSNGILRIDIDSDKVAEFNYWDGSPVKNREISARLEYKINENALVKEDRKNTYITIADKPILIRRENEDKDLEKRGRYDLQEDVIIWEIDINKNKKDLNNVTIFEEIKDYIKDDIENSKITLKEIILDIIDGDDKTGWKILEGYSETIYKKSDKEDDFISNKISFEAIKPEKPKNDEVNNQQLEDGQEDTDTNKAKNPTLIKIDLGKINEAYRLTIKAEPKEDGLHNYENTVSFKEGKKEHKKTHNLDVLRGNGIKKSYRVDGNDNSKVEWTLEYSIEDLDSLKLDENSTIDIIDIPNIEIVDEEGNPVELDKLDYKIGIHIVGAEYNGEKLDYTKDLTENLKGWTLKINEANEEVESEDETTSPGNAENSKIIKTPNIIFRVPVEKGRHSITYITKLFREYDNSENGESQDPLSVSFEDLQIKVSNTAKLNDELTNDANLEDPFEGPNSKSNGKLHYIEEEKDGYKPGIYIDWDIDINKNNEKWDTIEIIEHLPIGLELIDIKYPGYVVESEENGEPVRKAENKVIKYGEEGTEKIISAVESYEIADEQVTKKYTITINDFDEDNPLLNQLRFVIRTRVLGLDELEKELEKIDILDDKKETIRQNAANLVFINKADVNRVVTSPGGPKYIVGTDGYEISDEPERSNVTDDLNSKFDPKSDSEAFKLIKNGLIGASDGDLIINWEIINERVKQPIEGIIFEDEIGGPHNYDGNSFKITIEGEKLPVDVADNSTDTQENTTVKKEKVTIIPLGNLEVGENNSITDTANNNPESNGFELTYSLEFFKKLNEKVDNQDLIEIQDDTGKTLYYLQKFNVVKDENSKTYIIPKEANFFRFTVNNFSKGGKSLDKEDLFDKLTIKLNYTTIIQLDLEDKDKFDNGVYKADGEKIKNLVTSHGKSESKNITITPAIINNGEKTGSFEKPSENRVIDWIFKYNYRQGNLAGKEIKDELTKVEGVLAHEFVKDSLKVYKAKFDKDNNLVKDKTVPKDEGEKAEPIIIESGYTLTLNNSKNEFTIKFDDNYKEKSPIIIEYQTKAKGKSIESYSNTISVDGKEFQGKADFIYHDKFISKSTSTRPVKVDDDIEYRVIINQSMSPLGEVTITDNFTNNMKLVEGSISLKTVDSNEEIKFNKSNVENGFKITFNDTEGLKYELTYKLKVTGPSYKDGEAIIPSVKNGISIEGTDIKDDSSVENTVLSSLTGHATGEAESESPEIPENPGEIPPDKPGGRNPNKPRDPEPEKPTEPEKPEPEEPTEPENPEPEKPEEPTEPDKPEPQDPNDPYDPNYPGGPGGPGGPPTYPNEPGGPNTPPKTGDSFNNLYLGLGILTILLAVLAKRRY